MLVVYEHLYEVCPCSGRDPGGCVTSFPVRFQWHVLSTPESEQTRYVRLVVTLYWVLPLHFGSIKTKFLKGVIPVGLQRDGREVKEEAEGGREKGGRVQRKGKRRIANITSENLCPLTIIMLMEW